jgi:hypothetical protein
MAYQERRAEGGTGLIILTAMHVHESSQLPTHFVYERDDIARKFQQMSTRVHRHGAKVISQLFHFGVQGKSDCRDDFLGWRPRSYREHFMASRFKGRDIVIAAYDAADPNLRNCLDTLAGTMTAVLEATRAAMRADMPREAATVLANRASAWLRPLVARAGAVINGQTDAGMSEPITPQAVVDGLMKHSA